MLDQDGPLLVKHSLNLDGKLNNGIMILTRC